MSKLSQIARLLPAWRVSVEVDAKSGKFRLLLWRHNHKVAGLWRETIEAAVDAGIEKILEHPRMTLDLPDLRQIEEVRS